MPYNIMGLRDLLYRMFTMYVSRVSHEADHAIHVNRCEKNPVAPNGAIKGSNQII